MLAIIGGTGLSQLEHFERVDVEAVPTAYAEAPVAVLRLRHEHHEVLFLPRHGEGHVLPPHRINYRANIQALKLLGATHVIAINAVGGIHVELGPGHFAVPDQIIDYTSGRSVTFFVDDQSPVHHIDFTQPYDENLRQCMLRACGEQVAIEGDDVRVLAGGVYGCTDGPRLETAAEVRRLKRDGCDMVGMTGMPEAALAREQELAYASLALSVNWAAGLGSEAITMEKIHQVLDRGMHTVRSVLQRLANQDFN
jgi:5'-methylthioinosine phosphorylase